MWLLACSCAFIAGVAFGATRDFAWFVVLCPAIAFGFLLARRTPAVISLLVVSVAAFALLGAMRYEQSLPTAGPSLISHYNDSAHMILHARVSEEPDYGGRYTQLLLDDIHVEQEGSPFPVHGKVLVTTSDPRPLHYGDTVSFRGSLQTPPQLGDFDYAAYLALRGVYSTAFCTRLEAVPADGYHALAQLLSLNSRLGKAMASILPEPEASLAQSILLGRRAGLPDALVDAFARTGTAHLLAISGLHLGILVAAIVTVLLAALGRRRYLYVWIALLALWTYAVFTGLRPPVVRAAIMASTFLLAELTGRQKHAPTALALAAAVMVGIDPRLLWQTSFQLSVLAMGGLVLLYRPIQALLTRLIEQTERRFNVRLSDGGTALDIVAATLAATLTVWPVCAVIFGQVSVLSVPVSLLTLPVLPFALGSAAAASAVALLSPVLAAPLAWVAWLFLTYIVATVEAFSSLPWAVTEPAAGRWFVAAYLAMLSAIPLVWQRLRRRLAEDRSPRGPEGEGVKVSRLRWALPPLLLAAVLVWSAVLSAPDGRLHVVFFDVGQGDSILVVSPSGRTVLIDGGQDGRDTCLLIDSHRPFWNRSLDIVVATHPHADHLGGLLSVVERYEVGLVLEPCIPSSTLLSEEWARRLSDSGYTPVCGTAGQEVLLDDAVRLQILNPMQQPLSGTSDDVDNNGVVIRISYEEVSFLFTADIMTETERRLTYTRSSSLDSDVLKAPHHGSSSSSTTQFLAAVSPAVAVISVGQDNPYGHPHEEVLERMGLLGAQILTTAEHGTIEFITDGRELWVSTGRAATAPS